MIAQVYLFIGSGVERCNQKQILNGVKKEKLIKSDLWIKGIFVYNLAIPFIITSNCIYFITSFHVKEDLNTLNNVYFQKSKEIIKWREDCIMASHIVPLTFVLIEFLMNKIRTPWHHVIYLVFITLGYFLVSFGMEYLLDMAVYPKSLNFRCHNTESYIYSQKPNVTGVEGS